MKQKNQKKTGTKDYTLSKIQMTQTFNVANTMILTKQMRSTKMEPLPTQNYVIEDGKSILNIKYSATSVRKDTRDVRTCKDIEN